MTLVNCTLIARRPSVFQAGHMPSWRGSCGCYALPLVAAGGRWLLLLLSPLLSAVCLVPNLRGLSGAVTASCPPQAPPPNPTAAEPDGRRVLSGGGAADHDSDAAGALDRFRLSWTLLRRVRGRPPVSGLGCLSWMRCCVLGRSMPRRRPGSEVFCLRKMLPARDLGGIADSGPGAGSQFLQPGMVPGGAQLSGMFLAITVILRVTGLPGTAKMPPPWAALLRVTWLNLMVSGPPGAGPV